MGNHGVVSAKLRSGKNDERADEIDDLRTS